ncbi:hypothetical protein ACKS0A_05810 [Histoplasma ohiense]
MVFIWEDLRHYCSIYPVLLRQYITALYNLFQKRLEYYRLISFQIYQLAQSHQVTSNQELQLFPLLCPDFSFPRMTLVL